MNRADTPPSPLVDRRTATAFLVAVVFFMENLDATVITTSLPAMAASFGTAPARLSVGVSAYLVALTVFIPPSGWLADRFGPRRIFAAAIIVFTVASLLCAVSTGLATFTLARILQGVGGAMMVPVGRIVVLRGTPKAGIVRAIAILTWPALVAPVLGPPLGGWISTHWSWHWIFLLNLPLGVLALIGALVLVHDGPGDAPPFDWPGFAGSALGIGLLMGGIEAASRPDGAGPIALVTVLLAIGLLVATARHLERAPHPLFDLAPLKIATFRVTAVGGSLFRIAIGTAPFLLPLMFQLAFGWSAVEAGALLLWLFAGNLLMKPATTWIMNRFGFRRVLVVNGLLVAAGFAGCAMLGPSTPPTWVAALLFVCGMTRSMQFTALNSIGFADVPADRIRDASTLFSIFQQLNAGMGIAVGALALTIAARLLGSDPAQPATMDFRLAFGLIAVLALVAIVDSARLPARAGDGILAPR